jgi:hypothetical protein
MIKMSLYQSLIFWLNILILMVITDFLFKIFMITVIADFLFKIFMFNGNC